MPVELSVIIPIYNEEANINLLYERLQKVVAAITNDYEFIFVNDGSKDKSFLLIKYLCQQDPRIKYLNFSRNFGHQIAVFAGLEACTGKAAVIIDADLQDPPELIGELYTRLRSGYEVVYAKRRSRKGEGFLKRFTAKMFYRVLQRITNVEIPVDTGDFRIIDRKIVDLLKQMPEQHKYLRGQISWLGFNHTFVEYDRDARHAGKTGYTYRKMIRFALDGITSFSDFPLKFVTMAGFVVSGISFLLMLYAIYSKFFSKTYQTGWTSLMLTVLFIGGIQLIGIGIIGEYISRIHSDVKKRPLYIVSESNIAEEKKS
ncbi:MAG TPA: glycosyltransferase family 2 protein [Bacteroidia bacterium]|jgi:dolichol-phosphate mannosyltransferase